MARRRTIVAIEGSEAAETARDLKNADEAVEVSGEDSGSEVLSLDEEWIDEAPEEESAASGIGFAWLIPAVFILAAAGWTAFFGWSHREAIQAGASPAQWADWIGAWAMPVVLIVGLWLLAMRHSRREASRFNDAARAISFESGRLEKRLSVVNRELSLAREFIAAQSRDLESLGRTATERLSQNADRLQGLIHDNGAQIDAIAGVSGTALENMNRLRDELPVIANSARDVTSQIGNVGRTAQTHIDELVRAFERLNEFGKASGEEVAALQAKVGEAITAFEAQTNQLTEITTARFAALGEESEAFRAKIEGREVEALAAMRRRVESLVTELDQTHEELGQRESVALEALGSRIAQLREDGGSVATSLGEGQEEAAGMWREAINGLEERMKEAIQRIAQVDAAAIENARKRLGALEDEAQRVDAVMGERLSAFEGQVGQRRSAIAEGERAAIEALEQRLADLDGAIAERQHSHLAHAEALGERSEGLAARFAELNEMMRGIAQEGGDYEERLASAIGALGRHLEQNRNLMAASEETIADLTNACVRLLELIRASAEHSRDDLPLAITQAEERLASFEAKGRELGVILGSAKEDSEKLSEYVIAARGEGEAAREQLQALRSDFEQEHATRLERLGEIKSQLGEIDDKTSTLAEHASARLAEAVASFREATGAAIEDLDSGATRRLEEIAREIGRSGGEAMDGVLEAQAGESITRIEEAATRAAEKSRETIRILRDQLARVDELAGNLEARVTQARERAEEQIDSDFSRRVALITESLNSQSIDISRALSQEVTDTEWASYLRGDRGIFTRRAVRLIDRQEARDIAEAYDDDAALREHINRYIHDFEAMLRSMLSTRDGNSLAVTMLSSDMGKLYVALAQAIDRLRD